ncbi:putative phosphonate C-P lyase system protein PhnK [Selenomonas sp. oral taxon 892 str. F0426]|uniref:dipeptide ABC transporter ATP-binding protein n=1 Tax=Selenomonas sp. oral taxon 892 TaxID=1321785 RepID=UPI0003AD0F31|nr:ABC transporter ATP-binding protein [Selenomonas sp. oral taxon 892]ERJ95361.1 putative phosphonate C-P lyase system protein PhnK [Selenomonas sp. oral taxon 892 str. F0426]
MQELLRIDHLTAGYGANAVIEDISISLHAGEVLGIVGESGSGKSTLLKAIAQIRGLSTEIHTGTVSFETKNLAVLSEGERRRLRGEEIAMVFQYAGASLNPTRRIGTQLAETMRAHTDLSREEIDARAAEVFGGMGFADAHRILSAYPFELSGGMAQRAAIALAVILRPQLLLADEPTSALDATIQLQVLDELRALKERTGTAILLITHNIGVVRHIADRVAVMCKGKIVEQGSVDEVLGNPQHPYTQELLAAVPKMSATHTDCDRMEHMHVTQDFSAITKEKKISDDEDTLLRFDNVSMHFDDAAGRVQAIDGISFSLGRRELLGIVGESGSGKSTVAKLLTGLHTATGGSILLNGRDITHTSGKERRALYTRMQMVFQDAPGSFNPRRSIGAMIGETICRLCTPDARTTAQRVGELLTEVGLPSSYANRYPHEMSGGECQRAAIARAMAVHPEILVCDEATSALDVSVQAKIIALLLHLQREHGMSLLFISHDLPLVSSIADRVLIMQNGRIVEQGETNRVLREPGEDYTRNLLQAAL